MINSTSSILRLLPQALATWQDRHRVPGAQYLLVQRGEVVVEHAVGLADAATGRPVSAATTFSLYSITKPFTAAATVRAAASGRLDLDAGVAGATGLSALSGFGTVRQALAHRAGFPNPLPLRWVHRAQADSSFDERAFVDARLQALAGRRPRTGRFAYSNLGYLAVGRALERACGQEFRTALQEELLARLPAATGARLGFAIDPAVHAPGLVRRRSLHALALRCLADRSLVDCAAGPWWQVAAHHVDGSAYGGLIGNARGLAAFGSAMLGLAPGLEAPERETLPLVWFEGQLLGHRWFAHAGGGLGGYGELRLYPALGTVSVLLTNTVGLRDMRWLDTLDAAWLGGEPPPRKEPT